MAGEVNQVKFSEAELIAIHLNIVDRGVPRRHLEIACSESILSIHRRNACIILYSCTKYGEVSQVKFSEAESLNIHLNIVDRGVPRRHLEIACSK